MPLPKYGGQAVPLPTYAEAVARLAGEERGEGWLVHCEREGIFQLPTLEWVDAIAAAITPLGAKCPLEVGAGSGVLGRALIERKISILLTDPLGTDPSGTGPVERLGVADALEEHRPDLVLSCWLPFDLGAEKIIFAHPAVRWYMAVVQTGPSFTGSEALWADHGWRSERIEAADRWSVSRSDFLSEVDRGDHIRHGAVFLFERTNNHN
jgi:hypothetical protein